jgi:hypothetical protein
MPSTDKLIISPILVGRSREIAVVEKSLRAVEQGVGQVVLLSGEAGVGKSRHAAEICRHALAQEFILLEGHCFERDLVYPYAPLIDALLAFVALQPVGVVAEAFGALGAEMVKLAPELALLVSILHIPQPDSFICAAAGNNAAIGTEAAREVRRLDDPVEWPDARHSAHFRKGPI